MKASYEPTDEECEWKADEEEELTVSKKVQVTLCLLCHPSARTHTPSRTRGACLSAHLDDVFANACRIRFSVLITGINVSSHSMHVSG